MYDIGSIIGLWIDFLNIGDTLNSCAVPGLKQ